jgi:hypothetical protein
VKPTSVSWAQDALLRKLDVIKRQRLNSARVDLTEHLTNISRTLTVHCVSIHQDKRSGKWVVRYRDASGRNRSKTFTTRQDAEDFEHEMRHAKEQARADVALKLLDRDDPNAPVGRAYGLTDPLAQEALRRSVVVNTQWALEMDADTVPGWPESFRDHFDGYEADWLITVVAVGWKLAQGRPHRWSNMAEEFAAWEMIESARQHFVDDAMGETDPNTTPEQRAAASEALNALSEEAFEDWDFHGYLTGRRPTKREAHKTIATWFEPFGGTGAVHPFILDTGYQTPAPADAS